MQESQQTAVTQAPAASTTTHPAEPLPPLDRGPLRATAMVHLDDPRLAEAIRLLGNAFVDMVQSVPRFYENCDSHLLTQLRAIADDLRHLAGFLDFDVAQGGNDTRLSRRTRRRLRKRFPEWVGKLSDLAREIETAIGES